MNKRGIERGEEGENKISWEGGPTKLPERGGGQQQRPGKEEPLVGRRQEGANDQHRHYCWNQFLVGFLRPVIMTGNEVATGREAETDELGSIIFKIGLGEGTRFD